MASKIGLLHLELRLTGAQSLKEKRGLLKPLLHQISKRFKVSVAEVDFHDQWQRTLIAVALVGNDKAHIEQSLQGIVVWLEKNQRIFDLVRDELEIIQ